MKLIKLIRRVSNNIFNNPEINDSLYERIVLFMDELPNNENCLLYKINKMELVNRRLIISLMLLHHNNSGEYYWSNFINELDIIRIEYGNNIEIDIIADGLNEDDDKYSISDKNTIGKVRTNYYSDREDNILLCTFKQMKDAGWSEAVIEDNGLVLRSNELYIRLEKIKEGEK